jgi:hypothetical protein
MFMTCFLLVPQQYGDLSGHWRTASLFPPRPVLAFHNLIGEEPQIPSDFLIDDHLLTPVDIELAPGVGLRVVAMLALPLLVSLLDGVMLFMRFLMFDDLTVD